MVVASAPTEHNATIEHLHIRSRHGRTTIAFNEVSITVSWGFDCLQYESRYTVTAGEHANGDEQ